MVVFVLKKQAIYDFILFLHPLEKIKHPSRILYLSNPNPKYPHNPAHNRTKAFQTHSKRFTSIAPTPLDDQGATLDKNIVERCLAQLGVQNFRAIVLGLRDPDPRVRKAAFHSIVDTFRPEEIVEEFGVKAVLWAWCAI